jgi:hypothetical protein
MDRELLLFPFAGKEALTNGDGESLGLGMTHDCFLC